MKLTGNIWFDFDNTPHVQFLIPIAEVLNRKGYKLIYTARNHSQTVPLLSSKSVPFSVIGHSFGTGRLSKLLGTCKRALQLTWLLRNERPMASFSSSRASAIAAFLLRIPSFIFCDYEHVELTSYRLLSAFLVVPDVIPRQVFLEKGFTDSRLIAYPGLKEDITLYSTNLGSFEPFVESDMVTVVLRPPAEYGHYFTERSLTITQKTLDFLASRKDVLLIFSPRYKDQENMIADRNWHNDPIILTNPVPFISLMKSADLVISSGGTMLREAAVLGVPAYSIFGNEHGKVDEHLSDQGKLTFISELDEVERLLDLSKKKCRLKYRKKPKLLSFIVDECLKRM